MTQKLFCYKKRKFAEISKDYDQIMPQFSSKRRKLENQATQPCIALNSPFDTNSTNLCK